MFNPTSTVFLSPPPRIVPHTPPSLSPTPSPISQPVSRLVFASLNSTRDVSQSRSLIGQQRASSTDPDPNGEQSRITMQTRVAVRDVTPHRFQIIPLREHRISNLPEAHNGRSNEPRYRSHELIRPVGSPQTSVSESLSCLSRVDENNKLLSVSSAYCLCAPQASACKHGLVVFPAPDTQAPTFVQTEKRASISSSTLLLHGIKQDNALHAPSSLHEHRNPPSVSAILPLSSKYPEVQKPYQRNVKSNAAVQDTINGSYIGSATGRIKCRVCSEDLTRCGDQKCTHGQVCLRCSCGDSSWHTTVTVTRRHAIYTDALVLPIISRGSSIRQKRRAPVAHNPETDQLWRNHRVGPRYSQGAPDHTSDKGLHVASEMVYSSQSALIVPATEGLCQTNPPAELFVPPVPRLRLLKKTRNLSTFRASSTHEGFAKHSNTVLELIAQLDQAIRDWTELRRDHAVLCATVQGSRL